MCRPSSCPVCACAAVTVSREGSRARWPVGLCGREPFELGAVMRSRPRGFDVTPVPVGVQGSVTAETLACHRLGTSGA